MEKQVSDMLASGPPESLSKLGRAQQPRELVRAALDRAHQHAGSLVKNLERDAAHSARDHGTPFPQPLRDREREAFAQRLLEHHGGMALERVDREMGVGWQGENR